MKDSLWTFVTFVYLGILAVLLFARFSVDYFARKFFEWKNWKKAIRAEINELCEAVEHGDVK